MKFICKCGQEFRQFKDLIKHYETEHKPRNLLTTRKLNKFPYGDALYEHHCYKCGSDWAGSTETPTRCKRCGSLFWDKPNGHRNCPTDTRNLLEEF